MNVTVTLEHHFVRTPDRRIWTQTMFAYPFWTRYLEVFEKVCIVARVCDVATAPDNWKRADGEGTAFAAVPDYLGPGQYLSRFSQIQRVVQGAVKSAEALIFRVPSQIVTEIMRQLRSKGRPYAVEVVGDPYDVFAPGANSHLFRPLFRSWFSYQLRQQCKSACMSAYVTEKVLQQRYPSTSAMFTTHYSSVELPKAAFATAPRHVQLGGRQFVLVAVGGLAHLYKAPDVLLDAVGMCVRDGLLLKLRLIGDGKHRAELEARAASLGLGEYVQFLGQISAGEEVRAQLDRADLFVLPSRQEGLPRAMIEAMARGLPCIGSTVGGIPELLPAEDLVPAGDVIVLATKLHEIVADPARMARMSARNLMKAREYQDEVLRERRIVFYRYLREKTEAWMKQRV